jgi:hypothetical protein
MTRKLTAAEIKQLEKTIAPQGFEKFAKEHKEKRKRDFNDEEIDTLLHLQKEMDMIGAEVPQIDPLTKIEIYRKKDEDNLFTLNAEIDSDGNLTLLGWDLGEFPEKTYGRDEYEYTYTIDAAYKDTLLLQLLKERLGESSPSNPSPSYFFKQSGIPYKLLVMP